MVDISQGERDPYPVSRNEPSDPDPGDLAKKEASDGIRQSNPYSNSTSPGNINYNSGKPNFFNRGANANDTLSNKVSPTDAQTKKDSGSAPLGNSFYRPSNAASGLGKNFTPVGEGINKFGSFVGRNKAKTAIGGGIIGAIIAIISSIFFILPLKIEHMVNNLQDHFFAAATNAVSNESDTLFSYYAKEHILPSLEKCRSAKGGIHTTTDKNCIVGVTGDTFVKRLYRGWAQGRLENKLATKYGIEFRYDPHSRTSYIKMPGLDGNGVDLKDFINSSDTLDEFMAKNDGFNKADRKTLRRALKQGLKDETLLVRSMVRFKAMRLLAQKYGLRFCIISCKVTDKFSDWKDKKIIAAKMLFAQRVLEPRSQVLGVVMQCLLTATCDPTKDDPPVVDEPSEYDSSTGRCANHCQLNGAPESLKSDREIRRKIDALALKYGLSIADISEIYEKLAKRGFIGYVADVIVTNTLKNFVSEDGAKKAGDAAGRIAATDIPYIGEVYLAGTLLNVVDNGGAILSKMNYVANSIAMVGIFSMYRTYADEMKTGRVDPTMVGSFTDSLGAGNQNTDGSGDKQLGGTADATQTPLYNSLIEHGSSSTSVFNLFNPKAYAAAAKPFPYICNDGNPVPTQDLICQEEKLNAPNKLTAAHNFLHSNPVISAAVGAIETITNLLGKISSLITSIPLIGNVIGFFTSLLGQLTSFIASIPGISQLLSTLGTAIKDYLLPDSPIGSVNSGGRTLDMMAGGADVSGNDFAHHGLGASRASLVVYNQVLADEQAQEQFRYEHQSVFARIFDTQSDKSPIIRLAMAVPSSRSAALSGAANSLKNPFAKIFGGFGSIFNPSAYAATDKECFTSGTSDCFGISQYAYAVDDPIFQQDPDKYWEANCRDGKSVLAWQQEASKNLNTQDKTYMPENDTTNPCLLIQAAIGSAGAAYDTSLLNPGDLPGSGSGATSGSTTTSSGGTTTPTGSVDEGTNAQLAQKILDYQKTGQYHCDNSGDCSDLQKMANGQSLKTGSPGGSPYCGVDTLDARVLQLLLYVIEVGKFKVGTFALCGDHHDDGPHGHTGGLAVDFSSVNGVSVNTNSAQARTNTLQLAQFLNGLRGKLAPRQLITAGYGGVYDNAFLALEIPNSDYYGGKGGDNADHLNHIHTGY